MPRTCILALLILLAGLWHPQAAAQRRQTTIELTWSGRQPQVELRTPNNQLIPLRYDRARRTWTGTAPAVPGWSRLTVFYGATGNVPPDSYELRVNLAVKSQVAFEIPWPTPPLATCNRTAINTLNTAQGHHQAAMWMVMQARALLRVVAPDRRACGRQARLMVQTAQTARTREVVRNLPFLGDPLFPAD